MSEPHHERPRAVPDLEQFFEQLTVQVFSDLAIADPPIVSYVASVLASFARSDRLFRVIDDHGRRLETLVDLMRAHHQHLEDRAAGVAAPARDLAASPLEGDGFHRYVGDYALFMSGIFREHLRERGFLGYYLEQGPRSYGRAATHTRGPEGAVFRDLAERFEHVSGALDFMRKTRFVGGDPGKQVAWLDLATHLAERDGANDVVN